MHSLHEHKVATVKRGIHTTSGYNGEEYDFKKKQRYKENEYSKYDG